MLNEITYNQLVRCGKNASLTCQNVTKSFTEKGNLILTLDDSKKVIISGKNIDVSNHRNRILELLSIAEGRGFNIPERSIKHYAMGTDGIEYVLVRW